LCIHKNQISTNLTVECLSSAGKIALKHPKLVLGFIAVLGVVFLVFSAIPWSLADWFDLLAYVHSQQLLANISSDLKLFFFLSGTFFLTTGVCGIGKQYFFKNMSRRLFWFHVVLVPLLFFGLFFYFWIGTLTIGY
jgi:hypothetical protein